MSTRFWRRSKSFEIGFRNVGGIRPSALPASRCAGTRSATEAQAAVPEFDLPFLDRPAAGRFLADHLAKYHRKPDTVVLALACGGVPVGVEIARVLDLPIDVLSVRTMGV